MGTLEEGLETFMRRRKMNIEEMDPTPGSLNPIVHDATFAGPPTRPNVIYSLDRIAAGHAQFAVPFHVPTSLSK